MQIVKQTYFIQRDSKLGCDAFFNWFEHLPDSMKLKAVGHRVVHGGKYFSHPTLVTDEGHEKNSQFNSFCAFS